MIKAFFWDRDGTLIVDQHYLNDPDRIVYLPGIFDALRVLQNEYGYRHFIVTNQSGIASGKVQLENLVEIHRRLTAEFLKQGVEIVDIEFSPHASESNHPMRKPNPGMIQNLATKHRIDLSQSYMVGDRMSDIEAGLRAGCSSLYILHESSRETVPDAIPKLKTENLVQWAYQNLMRPT